jgi:hypothetical protein
VDERGVLVVLDLPSRVLWLAGLLGDGVQRARGALVLS